MILIHDFFPDKCTGILKYCDILKANGFAFEIVNCQQADFWKKPAGLSYFCSFGQTTRHLEMQRSLCGDNRQGHESSLLSRLANSLAF